MITKRDLEEAIAECKGKRNPDAATCIKLAAFYTIRDHLFPEAEPVGVSYAAPPDESVHIDSDSEFARVVDGRTPADVWPVMDELMETLRAIQPRLYGAVIQKLL